MEIDMVTILMAGYAPLGATIGVLWKAKERLQADFTAHLLKAKESNRNSLSDLENRLAELEHANH